MFDSISTYNLEHLLYNCTTDCCKNNLGKYIHIYGTVLCKKVCQASWFLQ